MDGQRLEWLEQIARVLGTGSSRRRALRTVAASLTAGLFSSPLRGAAAQGECPPGLTFCREFCADLLTSPVFCGSCENTCASGACVGGACVTCEDTGLNSCPGGNGDTYCTDLSTDSYNCGDCGVFCGSGVCVGGTCSSMTCPPGLTDCFGACVDLSSDIYNCGRCHAQCFGEVGPGESEIGICVAGECQIPCLPGYSDCSSSGCRDLANDPAHCGACGNACSSGACANGACLGEEVPAAVDEEPAAPTEPVAGRPARIHEGTCADLSSRPRFRLTDVVRAEGDVVGAKEAAVGETSYTMLDDASLDDLLAADHAITVHLSGPALRKSTTESVIACGEIGGIVGADGAFVVGLRDQNRSRFAGIAYLAPDPAGTDRAQITVFVAPRLVEEEHATATPTATC